MQESSAARTGGAGVVAHAPHPHALPFYTVPDDALEMGASLGNSSLWVTTKGTGAVERVFSIDAGQSFINAIAIRYASPGHRLQPGAGGTPHLSGNGRDDPDYVGLRQDVPGTFELHPAYQRHTFTIGGAIAV